MEKVLDAVIAQLHILRGLDYSDGGFRDEMPINEVWFDDPRILPIESYPFIYVAPGTSVKTMEDTSSVERTLTIQIGLLVDPRLFYDETEFTENSASREMLRTINSIERHFERKSLRLPGGLSENVKGIEVGQTAYTQQLRGDVYGRSALVTLEVKKRYPRLD